MRRIAVWVGIVVMMFLGAGAQAAVMPLPGSEQVWVYPASAAAFKSADPANALPIGVGAVARAGGTFRLEIRSKAFAGPADLYLALYAPFVSAELFLLTPSGFAPFSSVGLVPWQTGVSGPLDVSLVEDTSILPLSTGIYYLGLLLTPAGRTDASYFWVTSFNVPNRAFGTSVRGSGDLGSWPDAGGLSGIAAGDAICQARAAAAGLAGTFKAWLSDDRDDAYCRLHGLAGKKSDLCGQAELPVAAGPWVRTDGFPFGGSIAELLDEGRVYTPLRYDEFGQELPVNTFFFASTGVSGVVHPNHPSPCDNWTSAGEAFAGNGTSNSTTGQWTYSGGVPCSSPSGALACFQTGTGAPLPAFGEEGKKAFLTSATGAGNLAQWPQAGGMTGLAAGDAICRTLAAEAGLANADRFKAWLSDAAVHAKDRIASDGPWVRLDGVKVAESKADLLDNVLFGPINLTEKGVYGGNWAVWTGTYGDGGRTTQMCNDWTDGSLSAEGTYGSASGAGANWSQVGGANCDFSSVHLYCLED